MCASSRRHTNYAQMHNHNQTRSRENVFIDDCYFSFANATQPKIATTSFTRSPLWIVLDYRLQHLVSSFSVFSFTQRTNLRFIYFLFIYDRLSLWTMILICMMLMTPQSIIYLFIYFYLNLLRCISMNSDNVALEGKEELVFTISERRSSVVCGH